MTITNSIGTVVCFCLILIIYFRTPSSMKSFKPLILLYTISQFLLELNQLFYKPTGTNIVQVIYPRGLLIPMGTELSKFLLLYLVLDFFAMNGLLDMMLINRYFAMRSIMLKKRRFYEYPRFYYFLLIIVTVYFLPVGIYYFYYSSFFLTGEETANMIRENINRAEILLSWQPSFLSTNKETPIASIAYITLGSIVSDCIAFYNLLHSLYSTIKDLFQVSF